MHLGSRLEMRLAVFGAGLFLTVAAHQFCGAKDAARPPSESTLLVEVDDSHPRRRQNARRVAITGMKLFGDAQERSSIRRRSKSSDLRRWER